MAPHAERPWMQAVPARTEAAEATTTDPGGEVCLLAVLDDDWHSGSEGSAGHPTRTLPVVEIDLPEGGTAAVAAEAEA